MPSRRHFGLGSDPSLPSFTSVQGILAPGRRVKDPRRTSGGAGFSGFDPNGIVRIEPTTMGLAA
jgi:hypothetical protein